jgi:hypothetical protein
MVCLQDFKTSRIQALSKTKTLTQRPLDTEIEAKTCFLPFLSSPFFLCPELVCETLSMHGCILFVGCVHVHSKIRCLNSDCAIMHSYGSDPSDRT